MLKQLERLIYELKHFSQVPIDRDELIHVLDKVHAELISVEDKEMEAEERYDRLYEEYEEQIEEISELRLDVYKLEDTISHLLGEIVELEEDRQEDE